MANNYLLFSEMLGFGNDNRKEKKKWSQNLLFRMEELAEEGIYQPEEGEEDKPLIPENEAEKYALEHGHDNGFGFALCHEIRDEGVWFYSEGFGDISLVISFVQEYFRQWDPKGVFTLSFAETCNKPRTSEFGGGAVVVNANESRSLDLYNWITETVKEMEIQ